MLKKELELQDEGSWALMIEESNVKALQKYHGSMAMLDINYYLSISSNRYYKSYFEKSNISFNRKRIVDFLLNEVKYNQCLFEIDNVLLKMKHTNEAYKTMTLECKFAYYCNILCEYIAYYNSVISDTFYQDIYRLVDCSIPEKYRFASDHIKDSLFATNNINLLTHLQTVDILLLSEKYQKGINIDEDIDNYVIKYKSTTSSSGNPNGITHEEVENMIKQQSEEEIKFEKAFLNNLHFRYYNAEHWSMKTAQILNIDDKTIKLIKHTSQLSYLKILMREEFQNFKIASRTNFLNQLINTIGKSKFDFMTISEIKDFICDGKEISNSEILKRKELTVFELEENSINFLNYVPENVKLEQDLSKSHLTGEVLIGEGYKRYIVQKIEQDEKGLKEFNEFLERIDSKDNIAIITNVLRPFLVPKLKKFGALITQYGGYTSHASVLCRELGINSMISVKGLMNSLNTNDHIEVDFQSGIIKKVDNHVQASHIDSYTIDLNSKIKYSGKEIGNKAANLIRINRKAKIPKGFVLTQNALANIDNVNIKNDIFNKIDELNCEMIVIRSSHESEDGNSSYAGLFNSYVNVDSKNTDKIVELIKSVYYSPNSTSIEQYVNNQQGNMFVIIQEMITADISGVILSSNPFNGYDYLLLEYILGDLCYLMQGDVTPFITYINKSDVINNSDNCYTYPAIIKESFEKPIYVLARIAIELEREFSHRVEIEWGIKNDTVYIFQVRPY